MYEKHSMERTFSMDIQVEQILGHFPTRVKITMLNVRDRKLD